MTNKMDKYEYNKRRFSYWIGNTKLDLMAILQLLAFGVTPYIEKRKKT